MDKRLERILPRVQKPARYTGGDYVCDLEGGTAADPGHTLVANPTTEDIDLNDLVFVDGGGNAATPGDKDTIVIKDVRGVDTTYYRSGGKWGCKVLRANGKRLKYEFVEGGTVPAGTGFWYIRMSGEPLKINFGGAR